MELVVHSLDRSQAVATLGPVVIRVIVSARTEIADIDRLEQHANEVLERAPVAGLWIVVHQGAPVIDGPTRRHAGQMLERLRGRVFAGYALLGLGFWAAAAISATLVLNKLMGTRSPIESSLERSAERLCADLTGVDPNRLIAAHDELFRRIQIS